MLIWINGAFGSGKTQTAHELQRRLVNAHVADPELLGFALHKLVPPDQRVDFQDLPEWRAGVRTALGRAEAAASDPLIVPMTVVRDSYFDEIVGGLRSGGTPVRHYTLVASPATLRRRLRQRVSFLGGRLLGRDETWAMGRIPDCVAALADERYAMHIPTDTESVDEVVEAIAADAGLTLARDRLSPARYQLRRLNVGVRHIRL